MTVGEEESQPPAHEPAKDGPTRRIYTRQQKFVSLLSALLLISSTLGYDLASGVIYAKLLEPRSCTTPNLTVNSPLVTGRARLPYSWSQTTLTATSSIRAETTVLQLERKNGGSECGGLGESTTATAWISSIYTAVRCGSGPLGGVLLDVFGSRGAAKIGSFLFVLGLMASVLGSELPHLYITTAVAAIGAGVDIVVGFEIMHSVFEEKKRSVIGLPGLGTGVCMAVFAFGSTYAMESAGWRGYYYVAAGVIAVSLSVIHFLPTNIHGIAAIPKLPSAQGNPCLLFTARFRHAVSEFVKGFRRATALYRDVGFHLMNVACIFWSIGAYFPFVFVAKRAKDFGADDSEANRQVAIAGTSLAVGSVVVCCLFSRFGIRPLVGQSISLIGMAGATVLMRYMTNYTDLLISIALFSFCTGPAQLLMTSAVEQAIKDKDLVPHCYGHILLFCTIPVLTGPPLAVILYDASNTYTAPYVTGGACLAITGVLQCVNDQREQRGIRPKKKTNNKEKRTSSLVSLIGGIYHDNNGHCDQGCPNGWHASIETHAHSLLY